jgi:hypothetical protein
MVRFGIFVSAIAKALHERPTNATMDFGKEADMLAVENNSTDIHCLTHPNHEVIPITDGTYQCTGCLSNEVVRELELEETW